MMVDSGAAITLVTVAWARVHGLKVTPKTGLAIRSANGDMVDILGTTAMTLQLSPTLDLDVTDVTVSSGDFY